MSEKTVEMIIQEIEKRIDVERAINTHLQSDYSFGYENALDNLLSWITEKGTNEK